MKRIIIGIAVFLFISAFPLIGFDFGMGFLFNYNVIDSERFQLDVDSFSDIAHLGLFVEVPFNTTVGIRFDGAVKFAEVPPEDVIYSYGKNIHWDGSIGPTFHLFGKVKLDPFIQVGAGSAGGNFADENAISWRTRTQIAIFMFGAGGIDIVLSDYFVIGGKIRLIPYYFNPSGLTTYKLFPVAANIFFGFRF